MSLENDVKNIMESMNEEAYKVDTEVLTQVKPEDVVFDNEYVTIVEPKNKAAAQLYGRDTWTDPDLPGRRSSSWVTSRTDAEGNLWDTYAYHDSAPEDSARLKNYFHRFYIILPKSGNFVSDRKYAKLMIQAKENGERDVWDSTDHLISDADVDRIFSDWGIPWHGRRGRQQQ